MLLKLQNVCGSHRASQPKLLGLMTLLLMQKRECWGGPVLRKGVTANKKRQTHAHPCSSNSHALTLTETFNFTCGFHCWTSLFHISFFEVPLDPVGHFDDPISILNFCSLKKRPWSNILKLKWVLRHLILNSETTVWQNKTPSSHQSTLHSVRTAFHRVPDKCKVIPLSIFKQRPLKCVMVAYWLRSMPYTVISIFDAWPKSYVACYHLLSHLIFCHVSAAYIW